MMPGREKQIWAYALWVEEQMGDGGPHYFADQIARLSLAGDQDGVALWFDVAERYGTLRNAGPGSGHG